ncbi:hypothetical protein F5X68DRAFT_172415 [Plectosphaerella plurivora]|uniref:DUF7820 domain-containing protein n=1 Tax=Plectosphaerella plurivora TaxID=936078 RepID=A0A9P9A6S1_9PEZI|nr:hypothetical protein F5X68DRAFT_172415 [Plectosphaerella plurivora]
MSVATSATAPVSERSYQGPQRPTHPYGLYTQATEGSDSSDVTVGFGRPDNYQRRIGPDGEDAADLIGPLGHTEELPPYTRYPDVAYIAKNNEVAAHVADPIDGPSTSRTTPAIPGAGGLGLATRNPEYESRDDLPLPPAQSRLSTRSVTSDVVSQHEINTAAEAYTEKQKSPRWQTRAKKRMWGIVPYWAVCLVAVALLIMGIVLGAVIGTLLAKGDGNNKKKPDEDAFPATGTTTTTTTDIIPLATPPADLPPLVEGTFSLPPLIESQAPTTCFNDTSQAQAWTCNVPFEIYSMTLANLQDASPVADYVLQLFLSNNSSPSDLYTWGTQPPIIEDPIQMRLVKDTAELELGPAWFGHFVYNKTVIIAEDRFPNVGSANKRRGFVLDDPTSGFRRAGVIGAQVGDRPWICEWPGTMLEIFIYPYQINSLSRNRGFTAETSSTSPIPSSSAVPPPDNRAFTETVSVGPPPAPTPRPPKIAAPPYPNIIKIEESRLSDDDSRAAVCTQVEICADGISSKPVYGANGQPIRVNIIENQRQVAYRFEEPTAQPIDAPTGVLPRQEDGKYAHLSECGCMWWFR